MTKVSQNREDINTLEDVKQSNTGENQYKTSLDSSAFDFTQKSWSSDFILNVEGTKLYVARTILSLASPVFHRMFQSDFKESVTNELELPGKKKNEVSEFLGCIYPNTISEISYRTALRMLPLAEEYQVLQLKQRCEKVLLDSARAASSTEDLCQLFGQACLYNLKRLRENTLKLISNRPHEQIERASRKVPLPVEANDEIHKVINASIKAEVDKLRASCRETNEENEILKDHLSAELGMFPDVTR